MSQSKWMRKVLTGRSRTEPGCVPLTLLSAVCEEGHQQRHVVYVLQVRSHLVDPPWEFGLKKRKKRLSRRVCVREGHFSGNCRNENYDSQNYAPSRSATNWHPWRQKVAFPSHCRMSSVEVLHWHAKLPVFTFKVCKISMIKQCLRIFKDCVQNREYVLSPST